MRKKLTHRALKVLRNTVRLGLRLEKVRAKQSKETKSKVEAELSREHTRRLKQLSAEHTKQLADKAVDYNQRLANQLTEHETEIKLLKTDANRRVNRSQKVSDAQNVEAQSMIAKAVEAEKYFQKQAQNARDFMKENISKLTEAGLHNEFVQKSIGRQEAYKNELERMGRKFDKFLDRAFSDAPDPGVMPRALN